VKVIWTRPALRALEAIGDYIGAENPTAAERMVGRVLARVDELATQPHIGRPAELQIPASL
jgi:plasmid stabilization system protein ParE